MERRGVGKVLEVGVGRKGVFVMLGVGLERRGVGMMWESGDSWCSR